jgi:NTP pyrophosphatase (non-canonical NTP hydrolase)
MTTQQIIFDEISNERERQDAKWGADRKLDDYLWLAILTEEVGETAKAALESDTVLATRSDLRKELVQVAAVAVAWLEGLE